MADKEVLFMVRKEKCIGRFSQNLPWRSANERVSGCIVKIKKGDFLKKNA
jgi:hypothetical protein